MGAVLRATRTDHTAAMVAGWRHRAVIAPIRRGYHRAGGGDDTPIVANTMKSSQPHRHLSAGAQDSISNVVPVYAVPADAEGPSATRKWATVTPLSAIATQGR
jgi:hypothetical protein